LKIGAVLSLLKLHSQNITYKSDLIHLLNSYSLAILLFHKKTHYYCKVFTFSFSRKVLYFTFQPGYVSYVRLATSGRILRFYFILILALLAVTEQQCMNRKYESSNSDEQLKVDSSTKTGK